MQWSELLSKKERKKEFRVEKLKEILCRRHRQKVEYNIKDKLEEIKWNAV